MTQNVEEISLPKLLQLAVEGKLSDVHTCVPAIVKSYDRAKQSCSVQPALRRKYTDGRVVDLPIINNVPVTFPRNGNAFLHFDLNPGDVVTLVFSERSLDIWKSKGGLVSPNDPRKFNLSDAYAIPGGYPTISGFSPNGGSNNIEISNGANHITIEKDGKILIKNGGGNIELSSAGKFKLTNNSEELFALLIELIDAITAANWITGIGPQPIFPGSKATIDAIKARLETLKG